MKKLKERWKIESNFQLIIVFIVFAINGSLSAKISAFALEKLDVTKDNTHIFFYYILLLVLVLPLYPFMLMFFGWIFRQSNFFTPFSKKMIRRMGLGFLIKE